MFLNQLSFSAATTHSNCYPVQSDKTIFMLNILLVQPVAMLLLILLMQNET